MGRPRLAAWRGAGAFDPSRARAGARTSPSAVARPTATNPGDRPPCPERLGAVVRTTPADVGEASQSSQTSSWSWLDSARGRVSSTIAQYSLTYRAAGELDRQPARGLRRLRPDDNPGDGPVEPVHRPEVSRFGCAGVQVSADLGFQRWLTGSQFPASGARRA